MATKIVTKNSSTASAVPTASDLVQGELAVNVADKRLFTEDNGGAIVELGTNPSTIDINAGSIDGTAIGASSASTGAFTTLTASGAFTSLGIDDNATSTAITIDSSENVGIGTNSPAATAHIYNASTDAVLYIDSANANGSHARFLASGSVKHFVGSGGGFGIGDVDDFAIRSFDNLIFATNNSSTERMRIDSSGNVGIGNSGPAGYGKFVVQGTGNLLNLNATSGVAYQAFYENGTGRFYLGTLNGSDGLAFIDADGSTERMRIDSSGNVKINGAGSLLIRDDGSFIKEAGGLQIGNTSGTGTTRPIMFYTESAERMRIDSSGNLLVGGTSAFGADTITLGTGGFAGIRNTGGACLELRRDSSDGSIIDFQKDGSSVGSIGTSGTHTYFVGDNGSNGCGLLFGVNVATPVNRLGTAYDGFMDLGTSSNRFDDIYATNGTIQTSDRNEKQDIAELSDAEQRVAVAAKGLLRKFRWKDSVAEKGDDARIHFGIIAQDLQAAFAAEGLDAGDYAMFISTTWTDEETNEEKTRMGVRYSELLAFIISAI